MKINIYTDGSSSLKTGNASWAFAVLDEHQNIIHQNAEYVKGGYIGRMELTALTKAVEYVDQLNYSFDEIHFYSDSQYVINSINKKWIQGWHERLWMNVKNADIWKEFYLVFKNMPKHVFFHHIKGHQKDEVSVHAKWNNYVDQMCYIMATGRER